MRVAQPGHRPDLGWTRRPARHLGRRLRDVQGLLRTGEEEGRLDGVDQKHGSTVRIILGTIGGRRPKVGICLSDTTGI
jgi:hypothetical protein